MNRENDRHVHWLRPITGYSIGTDRIREIVDLLGDRFDRREDLVHALIRHLDYIPNVTHLYLWKNQIGDEDAVALAQGLRYVPRLISLRLGGNQIGPKGAAALAEGLQRVPNLTYLGLGNNRIGDEGAAFLAQGLQHVPNLQYFDLGNNQIGPEGILYLSYTVPSKVRMDMKRDDKIHSVVLLYLLWIHSDYPFYDLLNAWKKGIRSKIDEKKVWKLLAH